MVFAVATTDQVLIYATDSICPLAVIGNVHYAPINDLTWHYSNLRLLAGSTDGYISILSFANSPDSANLIGKRIPNEQIEKEELREAISRSDLVDYKREEAKMQNQKNQYVNVVVKKKTKDIVRQIAPENDKSSVPAEGN